MRSRESVIPSDSGATHTRVVLLACSMFHAVTDATIAILPGVMPFLVKNFSLTYSDVGLLYAAILLVMVLLQPIAGKLADKFNELDLLATGVAFISLSCLLLFNASSYVELFLLNIAYSVGASFYHPVSYALLSRVAEEATHRTKSMGISGATGDLGNLIAFLSTGIFVGIFSWKFPFLAWGLAGSFSILVYLTAFRHARRSLHEPKTTGNVAFNVRWTKEANAPLRFTALIFFICISNGAIYRSFINFTILFLTDAVHLAPTTSNYVFSLFVLSGVVGASLSGFIAHRLGVRRALMAEFLVLSACTFPLHVKFLQVLPVLLPLLILSGFTLYATYPALFSLAASVTSFRSRGLFYGFLMSITFTGGMALSFIGGKLADLVSNISIIYIVCAGIALCAFYASHHLSTD